MASLRWMGVGCVVRLNDSEPLSYDKAEFERAGIRLVGSEGGRESCVCVLWTSMHNLLPIAPAISGTIFRILFNPHCIDVIPPRQGQEGRAGWPPAHHFSQPISTPPPP